MSAEEKLVTAFQVKQMGAGTKVRYYGKDKEGRSVTRECTLLKNHRGKKLYYRDEHAVLREMDILEYSQGYYTVTA